MQFGRVIDATLMMDKDTGRPRGFGFVTFDSEAAVDNCLSGPLEILGKPIEVKKAQPRGNMVSLTVSRSRFPILDCTSLSRYCLTKCETILGISISNAILTIYSSGRRTTDATTMPLVVEVVVGRRAAIIKTKTTLSSNKMPTKMLYPAE